MALAVLLALAVGVSSAAAVGVVGWSVHSVAGPTQFAASTPFECETSRAEELPPDCDRYALLVMNDGSEASSGPVTLTDTLPTGLIATGWGSGSSPGAEWACSIAPGGATVTCTDEEAISAGGYANPLYIAVAPPAPGTMGSLRNVVSVVGGGAGSPASAITESQIGPGGLPFELSEYALEPDAAGGAPATQAGGHPWTVTTSFEIPRGDGAAADSTGFVAPENSKDILVELPLGLTGNPQAAALCTTEELLRTKCPTTSIVGSIALMEGTEGAGMFRIEGPIYNLAPVGGYPAEFGFEALGNVAVYMYASVVRGPSGYGLRVEVPGTPTSLLVSGLSATFYGVPGLMPENGSGSTAAFLDDPSDCSAGALSSRVELESWENPGRVVSKEATPYQRITGCNQLQFHPTLTLAPSATAEGGSTQADEPSGYNADLSLPQTSDASELSTPPLKDATVTLPAGVSLSSAAAQGLAGCQETGSEGINIGSSQLGPLGRDEGDPEATELGEGHGGPGGNGSPYDDGLYHIAPGHCPAASTIGTVEGFTPVLADGPGGSAPLHGHLYLAEPKCGGAGQSECTTASATNGELFGMYLEVAGDGVIVKVPATVSADPETGQVTASFKEDPQLPISDLKLHFKGGPRAPLVNPQACGQATTSADLTPWSTPQTPDAISTSSFNVDADGAGGACPAAWPFSPAFSAGTVTPTAGSYSPLVLTFSRQDREQDLSGLSVTLPPGLIGKLAGIPLCGEAQANAGTCGAESLLGSVSVLAGSGEHPLSIAGGRVYLTTGYKGQPFGMSIVTPAVAGPFNLGNVVVRAAIHIDPATAQVTVTSDPLPQIVDGVPLRLRTVNVEINRAGGFTFNPTNCSQQTLAGTLTSAQDVSVAVSSPFTATGCKTLPFAPTLSASTQGNGTFGGNGASLNVKISSPGQGPQASGSPEANIAKVDLQLPHALPARLSTLQKACRGSQFAADPAGCPAASVVGTAKATTPVLQVPLEGPAYLVSHGSAAFPDVEFVLQADERGGDVEIVLDGATDIKNGITYSKFDTVPDAPISSFETNLPEGPYSVLSAPTSLCAQTKTVTVSKRVAVRRKGRVLRRHGHVVYITRKVAEKVPVPLEMQTTITGQNGAVLTQATKIGVTGCAAAKAPAKAPKKKKTSKHKTHKRKHGKK